MTAEVRMRMMMMTMMMMMMKLTSSSDVPEDPTVRRAATKALKLLFKGSEPRNLIWSVASADKKTIKVRHSPRLSSVKFRLAIHIQSGGSTCSRCPNPQLVGGRCQILSVELIHYITKGHWLETQKALTDVTCHEDFVGGVRVE